MAGARIGCGGRPGRNEAALHFEEIGFLTGSPTGWHDGLA